MKYLIDLFWRWFDNFLEVDHMPDYTNPQPLPPDDWEGYEGYWGVDEGVTVLGDWVAPIDGDVREDEIVYNPPRDSIFTTTPITNSPGARHQCKGSQVGDEEIEAWNEILRKAADK